MKFKLLIASFLMFFSVAAHANTQATSEEAQKKAVELAQKYGMKYAMFLQQKLSSKPELMQESAIKCALISSAWMLNENINETTQLSNDEQVEFVEKYTKFTFKCGVFYANNFENEDVMNKVFNGNGNAEVQKAFETYLTAYKTQDLEKIAAFGTDEFASVRDYLVETSLPVIQAVDLDAELGM